MERDNPIRVVVYQDGDVWAAQCLEYDIGAHGKDVSEASARLHVAIEAERQESLNRNGAEFAGISRAPDKFFRMYDGCAGKLQPAFDGNYDMALCA